MLETRTDEGAAKQFVDDEKLPILFEPGNPFAFRQQAFIMIPAERERSFALQPPKTVAESLKGLGQPLAEMLHRQIGAALADLRVRPGNSFTLNNVGVAYLKSGKLEDAEAYFRKALEVLPGFLTAQANLAKVYVLTNRLTEALRIHEEILEVEPQNAVVLMNMALLYTQQKEFDRAEELLDRVIALEPNAAAYNNRGLIRVLKGRAQEAIADLRNALKIDVRDAVVHNNLGVSYVLLRNQKRAARAFKAALTLDPLNEPAVKNLAQTYLNEQSPDAAISLLMEYLQQRKEDLEGRVLLAKAYFLIRKYEQSVQHLTVALRTAEAKGLTPDRAIILNNLGVVFRALGQMDRARDFFQRCLTINPENRFAYRNLAALVFEQGSLEEARRIVEQCLAIFPEDPIALTLMGAYYESHEDYEAALEYLERAITSDPKRPLPYAWLATILGEVYGDYRRAIARLEQGLRHDPKNLILLNNLAYTYLMLDEARTARAILDQIDEKDYYTHLTATRGLLLLKEGNVQEGSRLYNQAAGLARTRNLRNLVLQKKNLELARHALRADDQQGARRFLGQALSLRTRQRLYLRQVRVLLDQIESNHGRDNRNA